MEYSTIRLWVFILTAVFNWGAVKGQFYSGSYQPVSEVNFFNSLEVEHRSSELNPFEGDLSIKAYSGSNKKKDHYWDFSASTTEASMSLDLEQVYAESGDVLGVFDYDLFVDGCYFLYHILTLQNQQDETQLLLVEEIYDVTRGEREPLETNTMLWNKVK
ncbi:MAG: hypothetical protein RIF33_01015 [Cyclobacteriaceae bacterium]